MVIDCAKGVEARTIKLMDVCRLRDTPIMTFINKLDRDGQEPVDLLDEIETTLGIQCSPITWPIGMGRSLKGVYHLLQDRIYLYSSAGRERASTIEVIEKLDSAEATDLLGIDAARFREEVELVKGACPPFSVDSYLAATQTPVFFGSAISNFGVQELLDEFVEHAPSPGSRESEERIVEPTEEDLTGFIFKIQANMDPGHRDRIAFMRICSGEYHKGIRLKHLRSGKDVKIADAITFMAADRQHTETAYAGDIIGLHPIGSIRRPPMRAISSACTITAPSTSATVSRRAKIFVFPAYRVLHRKYSNAQFLRIR
jgi:peptide chain release factor 3